MIIPPCLCVLNSQERSDLRRGVESKLYRVLCSVWLHASQSHRLQPQVWRSVRLRNWTTKRCLLQVRHTWLCSHGTRFWEKMVSRLSWLCPPPCSSPQGHILVLAGFGNLRGQMEIWDVKKYKQVKKSKSNTKTWTQTTDSCCLKHYGINFIYIRKKHQSSSQNLQVPSWSHHEDIKYFLLMWLFLRVWPKSAVLETKDPAEPDESL